jgi:hypothetical protein
MSRSFGVVLVVIVLGLAALVVPSLRRARSTPGVQGGLGDVQTILSAERTYAVSNGGYFDEPACLTAPDHCAPGYPSHATPLLDPALAGLAPRTGYSFQFHKGPPAQLTAAERGKCSPSSLVSFAVVALPLDRGRALKAFCGDSSGRVCARGDGQMPDVKDGRCPAACDTLH